jgi:hypothetical protein
LITVTATPSPHFQRDVSGQSRLAMFDPDAEALTLPELTPPAANPPRPGP